MLLFSSLVFFVFAGAAPHLSETLRQLNPASRPLAKGGCRRHTNLESLVFSYASRLLPVGEPLFVDCLTFVNPELRYCSLLGFPIRLSPALHTRDERFDFEFQTIP